MNWREGEGKSVTKNWGGEKKRGEEENKKTRKIIMYVVCYVIWYPLGKY